MIRFSTSLVSSVGKKIYMSILGLLLASFLVVHLFGNLALLSPDKDNFNKYSHFLTQDLGAVVLVLEILLALFFIGHIVYAIIVQLGNWWARPVGYRMVTWAHHTSKKTIFSTTMIYTGLLILIFIVIHLMNFKYGQDVMYTTKDGMYIRDLYATVVLYFSNIWNVIFYDIIMILLGFHLSHGFWSAFQSLGINGERFTKFIIWFGYFFAVVIAFGFFFIPLFIYFTGGAQ